MAALPERVTAAARVLDGLARIGIKWRVDSQAASLSACELHEGGVVVVTSRRAIAAYDDYHPERIVCLVVKPDRSFLVFVNNREIADVDASLRRFWAVDQWRLLERAECGVCYSVPTRRRPLRFGQCPYCGFISCTTCMKKMGELDEDASRCPHCRQWKLDGDAFGTPLDDLRPPDADLVEGIDREERKDPLDLFADIVGALDGEVTVLPRVGAEVHPGACLRTCRLTGTDRISRSDCYMRRKALLRELRRLRASHARNSWQFYLYTLRTTFRVDAGAERPVEEVSLFQVTPDGHLWQLQPDAWKLECVPALRRVVHRVKVAHVKEHAFEMPAALRSLLADALSQECEKTVSFASERVEANFDVDRAGAITTMPAAMVARAAWEAMRDAGEAGLDVCARIHSHPGGASSTLADLVTYRLRENGTVERLSPAESRRIFNRDLDGLKRSKRIVNFL
jgi:hypothetical protein